MFAHGTSHRHCQERQAAPALNEHPLHVPVSHVTMDSRAPVILAVDDDPDTLALLRLLLRREGFKVVTVANGSEALQFMQQHFLPALVITDYAMPGMTGLELCKHLRNQPETRHIPIFLHSALSEPPAASLYDEVFTKPADLRYLVRAVRARLTGLC